MTSFEGNTWWWITETRVNFTSALFWANNDLYFGVNDTGNSGMFWQIYTLPNGNVQFRNRNSNTLRQLGICYDAAEVSSSQTQLCMELSTSNDDQQWNIEPWGDGTYKILNAANGTSLHADWHPGGPGFMSPDTALTPIQPAQHWMFSSIGNVEDGLYSTSIQPTSTASASASGTNIPASASASTTGGSSPSGSVSTSQDSNSGLSGGAAAGIGVGVAVAVIGLAALAFFLFRRRKNAGDKTMQELPNNAGGYMNAPYGQGNAVPGQGYEKTTQPLHEAPANQPSYEMYAAPIEMPPQHDGHK